MNEIWSALGRAMALIADFDPDLVEIIGLSLRVSLTAVFIAAVIGLPVGAAVALYRFPGRPLLIVLINALMGLPPVVVGLIVYLLLSRAGPFGVFNLLYTPAAMIIAQAILVGPIVAALTRQTVEDLWQEYGEQITSFGVGQGRAVWTLLRDGRFSLLTGILAGYGRASAEVGAVMIVGGNIDHLTRVMTTSIALETSKGNLEIALALGIILLIIALGINASAYVIRDVAYRTES